MTRRQSPSFYVNSWWQTKNTILELPNAPFPPSELSIYFEMLVFTHCISVVAFAESYTKKKKDLLFMEENPMFRPCELS